MNNFNQTHNLLLNQTILKDISSIDTLITSLVKDANQNPEANVASEGYVEDNITDLKSIMKNFGTRKSLFRILKVIQNTKSTLTKEKVFSYYIDLFSKPFKSTKYSSSNIYQSTALSLPNLHDFDKSSGFDENFINFISAFPEALQYFDISQVELLLQSFTSLYSKIGNDPFSTYQCISRISATILNKYAKSNIPQSILVNFATHVLEQVINLVSSIVHSSHGKSFSSLTAYAAYLGELLPFVAALEQYWNKELEANFELIKYLQQFWTMCFLFTCTQHKRSMILDFFFQWTGSLNIISRFFPTLISKATPGDYSAAKYRIQEILDILNMPNYKHTSDFQMIFSKNLPNINLKIVQQLSPPEAILSLSIYYLELLRANFGIIGPIFKYFEIQFNPSFSHVLDSMVQPIFTAFFTALKEFEDPDESRKSVISLMSVLILNYSSNIPRIQEIVDKYFSDFAKENPSVLIDPVIFCNIFKSLSLVQNLQVERKIVFNTILEEMFERSFSYAPNALFATVESYVIEKGFESFFDKTNPHISNILRFIPKDQVDNFFNQLSVRTLLYGMAKYCTIDDIEKIDDPNKRVILAGCYAYIHASEDVLPLLITSAERDILLYAWSYVAIVADIFVQLKLFRLLAQRMLETISKRQGIFGNEVDEDIINLQTAICMFYCEQNFMNKGLTTFSAVVDAATDVPLLNHPSSLPGIVSFARVCSIIIYGGLTLNSKNGYLLKAFFQKLILTIFSFTHDHRVFKYVSKDVSNALLNILSSSGGTERSNSLTNVDNTLTSSDSSVQNKNKSIDSVYQEACSSASASIPTYDYSSSSFQKILSNVICYIVALFESYINANFDISLQRRIAAYSIKPQKNFFDSSFIKYILKVCPDSLLSFTELFSSLAGNIIQTSAKNILENIFINAKSSSLAMMLISSPKFDKRIFSFWMPLKPIEALCLLQPEIMNNIYGASFVCRCFESFSLDESLMFIPQLVQSLRFDKTHIMHDFLLKFSKGNTAFTHYLLWNILSEKSNFVNEKDNLPDILVRLEQKLIDGMSEEEKVHYHDEFNLIDELDKISNTLLPLPIHDRSQKLCDELNKLVIPKGLYVPSNPHYKILSVESEQSLPLKSHARVPILVKFKVYDERDNEKKPILFSCIFKIHDDVRQDAMMIQFIETFRRIFIEAGIDCYLYPYRVFATGKDRGVLEVIPSAKSRHDLGSATNEDLFQYFKSKYGQPGTPEFKRAQRNFIKSMAPNSLICYLFQVKDRHNANIMIDESGHIIHIDFGFIFEISPGGNFRFERAPFKLTKEMIDVMGGSVDAKPFLEFRNLLIKCLFAARTRHKEIEAIADLMMSAGFHCFKADSIKKLRERFFIGLPPKDVVTSVQNLIHQAAESGTTTVYDGFQALQNEIYF